MTQDNFHIPVLSHEAIKYLINEELEHQIIIDGTLGGGGYTKLICERIKDTDKIISIDKDLNAIDHVRKNLESYKEKIIFVNGNFGDIKEILIENGIKKITGLVLDLGLSSYQLEMEEGFSYMKDTPLDMRAFKKDELTASDIINGFTRDELTEIFENYGEIGNAERLSKTIVERRRNKKIKTTFELIEVIKDEYKINKKNLIDFLAKIFQALRIRVNNELENLERVLKDSLEFFEKGGRVVIVSYHSLEDRIVKFFFKEESKKFRATENPFFDEEIIPRLKVLTKKPIVPSVEEIKSNPRSRSAKLRAAEII